MMINPIYLQEMVGCSGQACRPASR